MPPSDAIVATFHTHAAAEAAADELQHSGFDMTKVSVVGCDYHSEEEIAGFYNTGDRMIDWGRTGVYWGCLWGFLFGAAFYWVPGLGSLLSVGPLLGLMVTTLEGALILGALSAAGAWVFSIRVPRDTILRRVTALKASGFVVVTSGTAADCTRARQALCSPDSAKSVYYF